MQLPVSSATRPGRVGPQGRVCAAGEVKERQDIIYAYIIAISIGARIEITLSAYVCVERAQTAVRAS